RKHAERVAMRIHQRYGLHGPESGGGRDLPVRRKKIVALDVFYGDRTAGAQGSAAGAAIIHPDVLEVLQEVVLESALDCDLERRAVQQLDVAHRRRLRINGFTKPVSEHSAGLPCQRWPVVERDLRRCGFGFKQGDAVSRNYCITLLPGPKAVSYRIADG